MYQIRVKAVLLLSYFVFAILLNSVGTVILQVQNSFGVSASDAAVLEGFKDLSIAVTSFLVASFIVRIGYRRSMLLAQAFVIAGCLAMPQLPSFLATKLLFAVIGVSFALTKVAVFATLGLVAKDKRDHASLMSFLESFFMVGVLSGYFLFSGFVDDSDPGSLAWLDVYYLLAGLTAAAFALIWSVPIDESELKSTEKKPVSAEIRSMLTIAVRPLVLMFVISVFLYVLIEQSIMTWLPSFNSQVLGLSASLSIQMASILAGATAIGRFAAGVVLRYVDWFWLITICLVIAAALVLLTLPLASGLGGQEISNWSEAPLAAWIFPLIGLAIAPVYPAINSVVLSSTPKRQHAPLSGLIVVFSALGGTTGSILTGNLFEIVGGETAFYFSLLPLAIILVALWFFRRQTLQEAA